jgi:hypothetical protein
MAQGSDNFPWFADYANYLVGGWLSKDMAFQEKKKLFADIKNYYWEDPYLFRICNDQVARRCMYGKDAQSILR